MNISNRLTARVAYVMAYRAIRTINGASLVFVQAEALRDLSRATMINPLSAQRAVDSWEMKHDS